jgi:hypothetical protein
MEGIALWHFAIFVPGRFVGGIVGAFSRRGLAVCCPVHARASILAIADTLDLDEREAVRRSRRVVGVAQQGCRPRRSG